MLDRANGIRHKVAAADLIRNVCKGAVSNSARGPGIRSRDDVSGTISNWRNGFVHKNH